MRLLKESDKVLDYLDEGAMDAIQRGYLRQLLFAMYLDPDKPRDVIECYTFNITYSKSKDREADEQSIIEPIGRRDHDGCLVPLPRQDDNANETENCAIKILKRKATPESTGALVGRESDSS
ncbi:DNA binding protein [Puccinia graminis f. sp. tritici]|uniref:DNA binding protein n=1 Tax=Puccinia graminis f. sp. tritici TaxID=56615 RepID=A0A5B0N1P6_PUCGR|nr:DNA binding protein [Puccinia graminis f. sp. tritici]